MYVLIPLLSLALGFPATFTAVMAQPASPRETATIDAATLLKNIQDAYRAGPVADKVEMSASAKNAGKNGHVITTVVTARLDATDPTPSLRIEFSELILHATQQRLEAINRNEDHTYASIELKGLTQPAIEEHLPPIPLPQVAFAFGNPDSGLFKGIGKVEWEAPVLTTAGNSRVFRLNGKHGAGTITLMVDGSTWRLMQVRAEIQRPGGMTELLLKITQVDAGTPDSWKLDTKGRDVVGSLAMLKPREGATRAGQKLANIAGNSVGYGAWSLVDAFAADRARSQAGGGAGAMMLILFRDNEDPIRGAATLADVKAARTAAGQAMAMLRAEPGTPVPTLCEAMVVFGRKYEPERPNQLQQEWSKAGAELPAKDLRWSVSAASTIDRVAPAANCIGVVVLSDLTLVGTVTLEGRSGDPAAIATDWATLVKAGTKK